MLLLIRWLPPADFSGKNVRKSTVERRIAFERFCKAGVRIREFPAAAGIFLWAISIGAGLSAATHSGPDFRRRALAPSQRSGRKLGGPPGEKDDPIAWVAIRLGGPPSLPM